MEATNTTNYIVKGTNDDESTCSHCGRTNLKRVVWIAEVDADGNESKPYHYGVDCAARLIGGSMTGKQVHNVAKATDYANKWIAEYGREWKYLDAIASAMSVKFNVWTWVECDRIVLKTTNELITL